jgi:hypothetical protein
MNNRVVEASARGESAMWGIRPAALAIHSVVMLLLSLIGASDAQRG